MLVRLNLLWDEVWNGLWFIPALMTMFSAILAYVTIASDTSLPADLPFIPFWAAFGAAEGARGTLTAIATGIITVTGVVFSVTIVALQLASSQYSPRLLRIFMNDRTSQVVLGALIGTFVYALLVLRAVRSAAPDTAEFVPSFSVTVAIILTIAAIAMLIYFIDHIARSITTSAVINRAGKPALNNVENLFPEPIGKAATSARLEAPMPTAAPRTVTSRDAGYLLKIDEDALVEAARKGNLTIRMEVAIGEFILPGAAVASVWPGELPDESISDDVRSAFVVGKKRTLEQDLEFSITELADIAVKALSPATSDLTAAKMCIDRLSEILVILGNRAMPDILRTDPDGRLLFVARRTTYRRAVSLAFDDIRRFGAAVPSVAAHLLRSLGRIEALVHSERREPLRSQAKLVLAAARHSITNSNELAEVEGAGKWLDEVRGSSESES